MLCCAIYVVLFTLLDIFIREREGDSKSKTMDGLFAATHLPQAGCEDKTSKHPPKKIASSI